MSVNKKQSSTDFNPLSWAILFFSLWFTLRSLHTNTIFSWILFGMSFILLLSIYLEPLYKIFSQPNAVQMILPTIFILTIAAFIFGVLQVLKDLNNFDQILALSLAFILLGTYLMVALARSKKLILRLIICVVLIIMFVYRYVVSGFEGSWPLLLIIVQSIWATLTPNRFSKIPLV
jgi:hypothetical protein